MALMMKTSFFEVDMFKWKLKPPASDSFGGIIEIKVAYTNSTAQYYERLHGRSEEQKFIIFPKSSLRLLNSSPTTTQLLFAALRQFTMVRFCNNLESLASSIASFLCCKYRFSPEILSGQGFKPFILITLHAVNLFISAADKFVAREDLDELDKLIFLGRDFHSVRKILKNCYSSSEEAAKDVKHVEEGLEMTPLVTDDGSDFREMTCAVCLESFAKDEYAALTICCHIYHQRCITEWLRRKDSCPMCRTACAISV